MKKNHLPIFIFIAALCIFAAAGCNPADPASKTGEPARAGSSETAVENSNTARINEMPSTTPAPRPTNQQNTSSPAPKNPPAAPSPKVVPITMAAFDQLKNGMSYAEAARILGSRGTTQGELKMPNGSMAMYSWKGRGENGDWNITARFDNGKLVNKVQAGLK
jgi:hypothetical protein